MRFQVRWPDETVTWCYSPSLVVKEFLTVGESYPLNDFVARSREALTIAGERVRQKYGFMCTGASGQLADIEQQATQFQADPNAMVKVEAFSD